MDTEDAADPLAALNARELCDLLEGSTEGTWIFEPELGRVVWSAKLFKLLGYDEQHEQFDDVDQLIHPDDRDGHRAAVARVLTHGGAYRVTARIRCQGGGYKGIRVHGHLLPARPGAGRRLVGFLLDATEELEAKASLVRSEAQFRAFMDNCPAAVFLKGADGTHLYANEAAARIAGVTVDDMLGHTTADVFPPETAKFLMDADRSALSAPNPIIKTATLIGSDGAERHVIDTKFSVPDVGSDSRLLGGFGVDITDRVLHEERMRVLDRRVQESQRLDSIGMLAGGVAHDFNNLLLTIVGNAELALDEAMPELRSELLLAVLERCEQATALCGQLLLYAGESPSEPRAIQPAHVLETSRELFDISRSLGVKMDIHVEADLPSIHADEVQLRQVLMNLISNAAQSLAGRPNGRISLSCRLCRSPKERAMFHSWAQPDDAARVCFVVSDNGIGMSAERLQRAFEPFFTTHGPGRGLGMPTVLGIIKAHQGAISVDSVDGEGTEVEVAFPLAGAVLATAGIASTGPTESGLADTEIATRPSPVRTQESVGLTGKRVLVVDDQPMVLTVACELVEKLGAVVQGAGSGEEAIQLLNDEGQFVLAVVDVTMQGMSGIDLAMRIRTEFPATAVVLTSGYTAEASQVSESGFVFLRKPYRQAELRTALQEALERRTRGTARR